MPLTGSTRAALSALSVTALLTACSAERPLGTRDATVEVHAAAPQRHAGAVGGPLAESLAVRVQTATGAAVAGVAVSWAASGGGALGLSSARTDAAGVARAQWTLGAVEGPQTATATVAGAAPVTFTAAAVPAAVAPARLEKAGGDGQSASAGAPVTEPLRVRVVDAAGAPVRGALVTWQVTAGGGTAAPDASVTDALGVAAAQWQLGTLAVAQWVRASAGSAVPVTFAATGAGVPVAAVAAAPSETWLKPGAVVRASARVTDAAGQVLADRPVAWTTSDAAVATVSAAGDVTAVAEGAATVTASREGKQAVVRVTVDGAPPALARLAFAPGAVDVSGGPVAVAFTVGATDAGAGVDAALVRLASPSGGQIAWCSRTGELAAGTPADAVFRCEATVRAAAEPGTWRVETVYLADRAGNAVELRTAALEAGGFPTRLAVTSATPDVVAPVLTAVSFSPSAVSVASDSARVDVMLTLTDEGSGVFFLAGGLRSPTGQVRHCSAGSTSPAPTLVRGTTRDGTWACTVVIPRAAEPGAWTLDVFSFDDAAGNRRTVWRGDWPATGFPTTVTVSR